MAQLLCPTLIFLVPHFEDNLLGPIKSKFGKPRVCDGPFGVPRHHWSCYHCVTRMGFSYLTPWSPTVHGTLCKYLPLGQCFSPGPKEREVKMVCLQPSRIMSHILLPSFPLIATIICLDPSMASFTPPFTSAPHHSRAGTRNASSWNIEHFEP